jgi:hypothetical protein
MESTTEVTQTGQDEPQVGFDDNGQLKFSEEGLSTFKEMLKEGTPEVEKGEEEPEVEPEKEPVKKEAKEPEKEPEAEKTYKIKIDGKEEDITEAQLIEFAQKGKDYTRKTQQLSEEKNSLAPYEALIKQLQSDPKFSQHIAEYWQKPAPKVEQKQFDDPIEQLKWETKQEILGDVKREIEGALTPFARQMTVQQVQQRIMADPDYQTVHGKIIEYVKNQPPSIQKTLYLQLDQDTNAYLELFTKYKGELTSKTDTKTETKIPEPVKKTERAPILENSNSAPTEDEAAQQRVRINKAKAKVLKGGSVEALQEFLQEGGFLKHLQ